MTHLYDVQEEALNRAAGRKGYGYWLEMGMGKTLVCLTEFNDLLLQDKVDCMIVLCPNSLIGVWKEEIERHAFPYPTGVYTAPDAGVGIWNYESIIARAGDELIRIIKERRVYVVLDESVAIKNPRAKRTKRLLSVAEHMDYVRCLSGAPIVQSPFDAWAQLRVLGCGDINPNPFGFRNRYCVMGGWQGKQIVAAKNIDQLNEIMSTWGFIAKKKDWLDLPEQLYSTRQYTMTELQQKHYDEMRRHLFTMVEDEAVSVQMAVHQLGKMQQIASGFVMDETSKARHIPGKNPKLELLKEIVGELDSKVIVFTAYRYSTEMLAREFTCPFIMGGMSEADIKANKNWFNADGAKVFVAQVASGKYGLTLLGTEEMPCHTSIYYENTYSLDARIQSEARNHRHGQHYPVTYIDMVGSAVERKIIAALQRKADLAKTIMEISK